MNKRKQLAFNKLFNFCIVLGLLSICISVELFSLDKNLWGILLAVAALIFIVLPTVFTPCCYAFDSEGVSFFYVFMPVERFLWKDIYAIEVEDINASYSHAHSLILVFFYSSVFCLKGSNSIKRRFFDKVHIRKSFRTKYLLEKYWDGTITGYFFENTKKWINKRRAKKQAYIKAHFTDEIVKMEREIRAEAREWLKPIVAQAKQHNLDVRLNYFYATKDLKELKSRPQEGYTYTLEVEISHFNETDENRIVVVSADLLYVRLGKTSYRGVKNQQAKEEFQIDISDVLEKIKQF